MQLSEDAIEQLRIAATTPHGTVSREDVINLIETALAGYRCQRILKQGVIAKNIEDQGLGHTNHARQLMVEFWKDAREAVKKPGQPNAAEMRADALSTETS
jgi:hypothetical protein